jgi:nucleoside-diphosphate-sugar epimerase
MNNLQLCRDGVYPHCIGRTMALHLITGGGGYLGTHLALRLKERGHTVRAFDLAPARPLPPGVELAKGDIRDAEAVRRATEGASVVHHLAFVQSMSRKPTDEQRAIGIDGTRNALLAAASCGARRFVFTSTIEIYGTHPPCPCPEDGPRDPVGLYGHLKWEAERLSFELGKEKGLEVTALRMPTICGQGFFNHRPLLALMERALAHKTLAVVGDGGKRGAFVHVEDVTEGYALAAERPDAVGEAFNISARESATHLEIVRAIANALESRSRIVRLPALIVRMALPLGRALGLSELPAEQDGYVQNDNCYSIEKARSLLGYRPRYSTIEAADALGRGYLAEREAVRARSTGY